jgi:hypothetical protein
VPDGQYGCPSQFGEAHLECRFAAKVQRLRAYSHLTHKFGFTLLTRAPGPEPEAPHNAKAIGSGQAAAPIHRIHQSNERPVGGAKIGHAEEPVSAAGNALNPYYLLPPHACWRHKLLAPGPPPCSQCPSLPPPAKEREKTAHCSPSMPYGPEHICAKQTVSLGKCDKRALALRFRHFFGGCLVVVGVCGGVRSAKPLKVTR